MLRRLRALLPVAILAWTVVGSAPVHGQGPAQVADPEAHIVEELVVRGREPGPAWWRVSDRDTTVFIFAVPDGPIPPGVGWDRSALERRLKGANTVIGPPSFEAGLRDIPAALWLRAQLKSKVPMETTLPPALAERYTADAQRGGRANRFSDWQPLAAGAFLYRDSRGRWRSVEGQVRGLARSQGLRLQSSAHYAAMPLAKTAMGNLTPAEQQACLGWALDDIEAGEARARRAAEGWARGDVAVALTAPRGFDRCLLILAGGTELWNQISQDQANDIASALQKPGHSIAIVGLRRLLAENGVIARLEAKGLHVSGPGEP